MGGRTHEKGGRGKRRRKLLAAKSRKHHARADTISKHRKTIQARRMRTGMYNDNALDRASSSAGKHRSKAGAAGLRARFGHLVAGHNAGKPRYGRSRGGTRSRKGGRHQSKKRARRK